MKVKFTRELREKTLNELLSFLENRIEDNTYLARTFKEETNTPYSVRQLRYFISTLRRNTDSKEEFNSSDWADYRDSKGFDEDEVQSVKAYTLASGKQGYSVTFKPGANDNKWQKEVADYFAQAKNVVLPSANLKSINSESPYFGIAKVFTADWHIGAAIKDLVKTQDYNLEVLKKYLDHSAAIINERMYAEVHISINGDLIESFSGLNHQGTFKELELHGKNALITAYEVISYWLSKIVNVKSLTIISGNHDRTQASKELEYEGDVAGMIAYFLEEKLNIQVNYHPFVFTEVIDNICYINTHGDRKFVNNPSDVAWKYGKQGYFNLIVAAHLHSSRKKNSFVNRTVESTTGDSSEMMMIHTRSFFTGNFYSEISGWTSTPGFTICTNPYGYDIPIIEDIPLKLI